MTIEQIKDRIKRLLNLAGDDAAAEGEVANALRFARRLMLQHNVSESEVERARDPHERAAEVEYGQVAAFAGDGKLVAAWMKLLGHAICELVGTIKHYTGRTPQQVRTPAGLAQFDDEGQARYATPVTFYGPVADCRDAAEMYAEWSVTIAALARAKYGGALRGPGRSYAEGFASGLLRKVIEEKRRETQAIDAGRSLQIADGTPAGAECTAIVLRSARELMLAKQDRAKTWLRDVAGIRLVSGGGGGGGHHHGDAHGAGVADGRRANFSRTRQARLPG